jgi:hypothetical protein
MNENELYPKEGDECPHCKKHNFEKIGTIVFINGNEPYSNDHLMCDNCDSTYNIRNLKNENKK